MDEVFGRNNVSQRLGHRSIEVTYRIYRHLMPSAWNRHAPHPTRPTWKPWPVPFLTLRAAKADGADEVPPVPPTVMADSPGTGPALPGPWVAWRRQAARSLPT
ncbi:MAG: hypothetical protein ACRDSH_13535 [Pseudonocardiaceae bacterium]